MEVLKFLKENGLQKLVDLYKINIKYHKKYPNLCLLKYDQLESPHSNPITNECRGLILDIGIPNEFKVVSRSFDRFFNYGEGYAASIDWNTATCYEKLDGSLAVLYWYDGHWNIQTSGTPDACGEVDGHGFTFEKLFWDTWNELGYQLPSDSWRDSCFIFELCTKWNKVVVQHQKSRIVSLGVRSRLPYIQGDYTQYKPDNIIYNVNWEIVKSYPLTSFEEIVASCASINPMEQEGYVVCDVNFNRVKVKSPQYVALNNIRDGHGPKRIIEIIRTNEYKEFLTYFPEWKDEYDKYLNKFALLECKLMVAWDENCYIESQKEFALAIKDIPFNGALFMIRAGKVKSVREFLQNANIDKLVEYFK